jgi:hypothetical protein
VTEEKGDSLKQEVLILLDTLYLLLRINKEEVVQDDKDEAAKEKAAREQARLEAEEQARLDAEAAEKERLQAEADAAAEQQ